MPQQVLRPPVPGSHPIGAVQAGDHLRRRVHHARESLAPGPLLDQFVEAQEGDGDPSHRIRAGWLLAGHGKRGEIDQIGVAIRVVHLPLEAAAIVGSGEVGDAQGYVFGCAFEELGTDGVLIETEQIRGACAEATDLVAWPQNDDAEDGRRRAWAELGRGPARRVRVGSLAVGFDVAHVYAGSAYRG